MSISVNGESQVPPGFRFHPTEEELLQYYLRKKICNEKIDLDVIRDVDLNKLEPWDIQEKCKIGSTPQNDWYLFSHKDKKYPTGTRTNRATTVGFWKATGRDKVIHSNGSKRIGMRKTLVFYTGRVPNAKKSDWIMHEYRLDDNMSISYSYSSNTQEEVGWVVCRVFKKKSRLKSIEKPSTSSTGRGYKEEKLPSLDSPKYITMSKDPIIPVDMATDSDGLFIMGGSSMINLETLDRLVASQLNSQTEAYSELCCFGNDPTVGYCITCSSSSSPPMESSSIATTTYTMLPAKDYTTHDIDLWNFVSSTTSPPLTVPPVNTSNVTL